MEELQNPDLAKLAKNFHFVEIQNSTKLHESLIAYEKLPDLRKIGKSQYFIVKNQSESESDIIIEIWEYFKINKITIDCQQSEDNISKIKKFISELDWKNKSYLFHSIQPFLRETIFEKMKSKIDANLGDFKLDVECDLLVLENVSKLPPMKLDSKYELSQLNLSHVDVIKAHWFNDTFGPDSGDGPIRLGLAFGVFCGEDLVSWIVAKM